MSYFVHTCARSYLDTYFAQLAGLFMKPPAIHHELCGLPGTLKVMVGIDLPEAGLCSFIPYLLAASLTSKLVCAHTLFEQCQQSDGQTWRRMTTSLGLGASVGLAPRPKRPRQVEILAHSKKMSEH